MSIISSTSNQNINPNNLQKGKDINTTEFHPLEFYSLGKLNPNLNSHNILRSNNYSTKTFSKLSYNHSSHELFDRNLLSVNNHYFDKYKEIKPKVIISSSVKNENNYLDPLLCMSTRNNYNSEDQKLNNINSLEWFHLIKNKVYIIDKDSKIKKGNNITREKFYKEKGISPPEQKDKNSKGLDTCIENNNINRIKSIFNVKRYKLGNDTLLNKKEIFKKEKEITELDGENNYWRKLRMERNKGTQNTDNLNIKKLNEKDLKSKFFYFEKNHKNVIRHKNWWKIDP